MKKYTLSIFALLSILVFPFSSNAQMFSVGTESRTSFSSIYSPYVRAGVQFVNFEFKGSGMIDEQFFSPLTFNGEAAYIAYESFGLNLNAALGNSITGLNDTKYFSLNLNFKNPFYLINQQKFKAGIPVKLDSRLVSVRNDQNNEEFSQTSLSAGAGLTAAIINQTKFNITGEFLTSYGFSTASGGFLGGSVFGLSGSARINIYNLLFGKNLSIGYDYINDSYDIDEERLDYDLVGHTITLGVSF
ncbi:hypothetical protein [Gracilimonas amylolytica]|uniref:hypothetical protein n=1 Tax=Gracilimonas amylolytica TaxID=1749045 RepID=UPI000CD816D0|nr:hypothetical protein [Gracilimonas amylolytica]